MGIWGTLHPRRILYAPGVISVYGDFSPGKPRTRTLGSEAENCTDWATAAPFSGKKLYLTSIYIYIYIFSDLDYKAVLTDTEKN